MCDVPWCEHFQTTQRQLPQNYHGVFMRMFVCNVRYLHEMYNIYMWAVYLSWYSDWATGWTVRVSNPGRGARFSAPVQTGHGAHPASCTMGTGSFPGEKSGRGVKLTPHPLLVRWSRKSRAISLLPLWAVRPVQSLSACTRAYFTFFYHLKPRLKKQNIYTSTLLSLFLPTLLLHGLSQCESHFI